MAELVGIDRARAILRFEPETGRVIRTATTGTRAKAGAVIGTKSNHGYLIAMVDYRIYQVHRLAWFLLHGEWPNGEVDHINGDKADNRLANLRVGSSSENKGNMPLSSRNKTGFKGVRWDHGAKKFRASIGVNSRHVHLGYRETAEEAHQLYRAAALRHFGEFARFE